MEAGCPAGGASAPRREAGGVFRREVESAVRRLNPWMTEAGAVAVVERLEALPSTIEGNRELLAWLRGERQWYDEAEERSRRVRPADLVSRVNQGETSAAIKVRLGRSVG